MGSGTDRDNAGQGAEEYWRRRALALGGVLAVVAVLGWACTGDGEERATRVQSTMAAPSSPGVPSAMPTVTVTASPKASPRPVGARDVCAPESLAVTMRATDEVYGAGERPRFMITAVNIGNRTCTLDAGLGVNITSGDDRIWSSAACADKGQDAKKLRRGVPLVSTITWDRKRGCEGARPQARPGTYVATLKSQTTKPKAPKQVFALR